jgi:phospholipid/cholesterol/gamma-HCH transport system substrate-binding protein
VNSTKAEDLGQMMSKLSNIGARAEGVLDNLEKATGELANEAFREDIRQSASSLRKILESAASGQGYVSRVLNDPAEAERLSNTMANLEKSSAELDKVFRGAALTLERVNKGPGLAHELIYGEKGAEVVSNVGEAADEAAMLLKGLREQGGDKKLAEILVNLGQVTDDLKLVSRNLKDGKGTLGALLVDPSVYEDVKLLLGNVQRNDALRALVRYSIKRDETSPATQVTDPRAGGGATDSQQ